ncbi:hypothetical protein [Bradyrhizobium arachidis]|uniref:Uncharacterized protein n=1 Tax=Bradyrhizobium arachidis TaxID=858423 RepID=A0AAE7NLU5_9BRAD|nr:hypothetical protein [Bradyrhizobium arachidis]QOZ66646.1 hypothetical protein WN72_09930 [Bradyrhizobium arachidis]SFV19819.1 hypothetical protein SAMN05192541_1658 [Bradyrhizobium arachidis]
MNIFSLPCAIDGDAGPAGARPTGLATPASGRIEIVVGDGRRVIVDAGVDIIQLSQVLDMLERL